MLTKLQLEIIDKYVKEDFYDKEKLIRYLNMHEMVGNEIFDYVDRKNRNLYRKEAHSNILDGEIGYEPVNTETFVRRIPFYFYTWDGDINSDRGCGDIENIFRHVWIGIKTGEISVESIYQDFEFMFYEKGIEPVVSLVHFDMPDHLLKKYNGFLNKDVIDFYAKHVESVVQRLKGKVKYWITYNEINLAYGMGDLVAGAVLPEGMTKSEMYVQLSVNVQIAHARAVEVIKRIDPEAKVGGMIGHAPFYPLTCKSEDIMAADFKNKLHNYFAFDTMCFGELPQYFIQYALNRNISYDFNENEKEVIKTASQKLDYLAFSYYRSNVQSSFEGIEDTNELEDAILFDERNMKNPYYTANEWGWQIDAEGLRYSLVDFYSRYHKPLFIVENGIGIDEHLVDGKVYDDVRIDYYQKHISAVKEAVDHDGVDLMGYLAWSPIDFLSSHKEIRKRYGFVYVNRDFEDLKDLNRYKKKSFYWYQKCIATNGEDLENNIEY